MPKKPKSRWRHQGYYLKESHAYNVASVLRDKGYQVRILRKKIYDGSRKRVMFDVDFKGRKKRGR